MLKKWAKSWVKAKVNIGKILQKQSKARPRKPACGSPDFVDNFLRFFRRFFYRFICFALYAVRSSSMQYKTLLPFLRGGGGGGGAYAL